jgi:transglutaminase-like putative cysteine protease
MRYRVRHTTLYRYGEEVLHSHQLLHLVPRPVPYQECLEHAIHISPDGCRRRDDVDAFGNPLSRIELAQRHRRLEVRAEMEIEVHPRPALNAADSLAWERVVASLSYWATPPARESLDACRFRHESPYVRVKSLFSQYSEDAFEAGRPVLDASYALMTKLNREFRYAPGETTIATPLSEVLEKRCGVCQDFAHLMIACLRSRGLAARYVSGYVRRVQQRGSSATHAWVAVYCPPFGWVELDPTNNVRVGTDHVAVAWGRDFGDVSPLRGIILGGGSHELSVSVHVESIPAAADSQVSAAASQSHAEPRA